MSLHQGTLGLFPSKAPADEGTQSGARGLEFTFYSSHLWAGSRLLARSGQQRAAQGPQRDKTVRSTATPCPPAALHQAPTTPGAVEQKESNKLSTMVPMSVAALPHSGPSYPAKQPPPRPL